MGADQAEDKQGAKLPDVGGEMHREELWWWWSSTALYYTVQNVLYTAQYSRSVDGGGGSKRVAWQGRAG